MPDPDRCSNLSPSAQRMLDQVAAKQARMIRARQHSSNHWNAITVLGTVGWSVTVPTLVGAAAGIWIDHHWPSRFSWSLMLLIGGLLIGCAHAWVRVKGEHS